MNKLTVHIFSDSFGESGEQVLRCALSQFDIEKYNIVRHIKVSSVEILEKELKKIRDYSNSFFSFHSCKCRCSKKDERILCRKQNKLF